MMSVWLCEYLAEDDQIEDFMTQYLNIQSTPLKTHKDVHLYISSSNVHEYLGQHSFVSQYKFNITELLFLTRHFVFHISIGFCLFIGHSFLI